METQDAINLLTPTHTLSPKVEAFAKKLRQASYVSGGLFVIFGIAAFLFALIIRSRNETISARRDSLTRDISSYTPLEGLLVSTKERAVVVGKLLGASADWGKVFSNVESVSASPPLASLSLDPKKKMTMTIKAATVEELFPILAATVSQVEAKNMLSVQIVSLQLDGENGTTLVLSFVPVL